MFAFDKFCKELEQLSAGERIVMLTDTASAVMNGLAKLGFDDADSIDTLAAFVVGSLVTDGNFDEKEWVHVYQSLVKAFGAKHDFKTVVGLYKDAKDVNKQIRKYTEAMMQILAAADEQLQADVIMLCLLLVSADGHVSLKEKRYIKALCKQ